MTIGLLFWLLYVLWVVLVFVGLWPEGRWKASGATLIEMALVFLLGWATFGFIIKG